MRVRLSSDGFFMIRQSLHDPVISLQFESVRRYKRPVALSPLLKQGNTFSEPSTEELAATQMASSGRLRHCSDADTTNKCLSRVKDASILSWPTSMGH